METVETTNMALAEALAQEVTRLQLVAKARATKGATEIFSMSGDVPTTREIARSPMYDLILAFVRTCPDRVPTSSDLGHVMQMLDRRLNRRFSGAKSKETSRYWAMGEAYIYGVCWSTVRTWWRKHPHSSKPGEEGDKIQRIKDEFKKSAVSKKPAAAESGTQRLP